MLCFELSASPLRDNFGLLYQWIYILSLSVCFHVLNFVLGILGRFGESFKLK